MQMAIRFVILLAALTAAAPAFATVRITSDNGGLIGDYDARYRPLLTSGERVEIDGVCLSACTMVLGYAPGRVCVTTKAVLGFHAAWKPDGYGRQIMNARATQSLLSVYPRGIRQWIAQKGGLTPKMMFLKGRELAALVPPCENERTTARPAAKQPKTGRQTPQYPPRQGIGTAGWRGTLP